MLHRTFAGNERGDVRRACRALMKLLAFVMATTLSHKRSPMRVSPNCARVS